MKRLFISCLVFVAEAASSQSSTIQTVFGDPSGWQVQVVDDTKEKSCVLGSDFKNNTSFQLVTNGRISRIIFKSPVFRKMSGDSVVLHYGQGIRNSRTLTLRRIEEYAVIDMNETMSKKFLTSLKVDTNAGGSISLSLPSLGITSNSVAPIVYFRLDYEFKEALLMFEQCPSAFLASNE